MSLTVQQLIADAKKLSTRLMDRDQSADQLISRGQDVLKEVEAMRQYQENIENLNEIAHQRPRSHLVLGIQQENRHIRSLQQENKELRAALEEHQAALELIMSKYREHISRMIKSTGKIEYNPDNLSKQLHEKTMKVYEMAAVMKEAVRRDEEKDGQERELIARLYTENKGLRELLEISQRSRTLPGDRKPPVKKMEAAVQTEDDFRGHLGDRVDLEVTLPMPAPPPRHNRGGGATSNQEKGAGEGGKRKEAGDSDSVAPVSPVSASECDTASLSASESDETSDDDSVKFDTIKLKRKNPPSSTTSATAGAKSPEAAATGPPTASPRKSASESRKSVVGQASPTSPTASAVSSWNHETGATNSHQNSVQPNQHSLSSPHPQHHPPNNSSTATSPTPQQLHNSTSPSCTLPPNTSLEQHLNTINNNSPPVGCGSTSAVVSTAVVSTSTATTTTTSLTSTTSSTAAASSEHSNNTTTAASSSLPQQQQHSPPPTSTSDRKHLASEDIIEAVEIREDEEVTAAVTNCESIIYDIITESVANSAR